MCGLAPLDRLLVVLALPKAEGEEGDEGEGEGEDEGPERPQLMVFEKSGQEYELVSTDLLTIKWDFLHFCIFYFSTTSRSFSLETLSTVLSYNYQSFDIKGTQARDFRWLWFWILFFIVIDDFCLITIFWKSFFDFANIVAATIRAQHSQSFSSEFSLYLLSIS